ncbi:3-hydroxyacyl-CoA dehydrogenase/enoyl-CoA hydratase family protein [Paenibacillus filicis]|uniref:3-hydroxyacyl-CoA dehydrogenase/enoyl-CoA hydratase family protein n=1 Tax=Paenibacillus gyeongsangnamensis TaxID=3388067 RepID=A0ABT4QCX3_9BACL|nr:3-hydroxyacyl-CoA dehydrogenase/enoyl-CoA hydratase family protein [Paenibacillus filicis]MCZ8514709.1 3-hydroxyacyl-CoA dehydrogenase/enoyl-CoA hydratase family protein [Paenibacillus filicis]
MIRPIRQAAVLGSGVMGSGIAAHLANAGIDCLLLDLVPERLTAEEEAKGWTLDHPSVRNRRAADAVARLTKTKPAALYDDAFVRRITPGNLEDDFAKLSGVDWIIEVIVERLDAKKALLERVEQVWRPGTVVSSNTSGISVNAMAEGRSAAFRAHFLGTHFFNPPRYMPLLELIPGEATDPRVVNGMRRFCERKLGKSTVVAKDTPNFIANRIGTYGILVTLEAMAEGGFTVEEVDAVTGHAMGRPKSATFRTLDLVGLDTFVHVADNVHANVTDEAEQAAFRTPEPLKAMVAAGQLGEKTGRGFYLKRRTAEGGSEILSLSLKTMDYGPQKKVSSAALEAAKQAKGAAGKIKALLAGGDRYAELAWTLLKKTLLYSAAKIGEIADTVQDVDDAMRWGFNWELGPFEVWDAIGLKRSVERMEAEGETVPAWVKAWLVEGHESFYEQGDEGPRYANAGGFRRVERAPEAISLSRLKAQGRTVLANSGASLIDLGDGVACLEFHSPHNAIGGDILQMINRSVEEVRRGFDGLVIANQGKNFCVGANLMLLLMEAQDEEWDEIDGIIRLFQDTMYRLKRFEKPVVAAPHRMALGGGVEVCLPADRIVASAETYFGLVEFGVGLIPAGGGCKELALRAALGTLPEDDLQPAIQRVFETIGMAKVSTSGHDAIRLGLLRPTDQVAMHPDHLIYDAKQAVLKLAQEGYEPVREERFRVAGRDGGAVLKLGAYLMKESGYISDHDYLIASKLAHVLTGGDVPAGTLVTERHLLDLEREAFLSLCGEPKTQQRMQHMLGTGRPLRN